MMVGKFRKLNANENEQLTVISKERTVTKVRISGTLLFQIELKDFKKMKNKAKNCQQKLQDRKKHDIKD